MKKFLISFLAGLLIAAVVLGLSVKTHAAELPPVLGSCGYTAEELEERLKYDLKPYARAFLNAEEDYGINACFLASIAALESGWGRNQFRENNIFGFGKKNFESVEESIDYVAWYLYKHYIREDGRYYRGGTIEAIGSIYCPDGTGDWPRLVSGIYYNLINT